MSYEVIAVPKFGRELKKLAKKYPSIRIEFSELVKSLESNPNQGTLLGNNCYKIRLAIASKGKGASGGARVIINIVVSELTVYLLSIYDKSKKANITDKELIELLRSIPQ